MELTVNPKEFGIEESKANELTSGLSTTLAEREALKESYNSVISLEITEDNLEIFRSLRLKIRDNRTKGIEKWHKANKEFFLTGGRFVDAIKNKEVIINEEMEAKLLEAEKFFENKEKVRLKAIHNDRVAQLLPFGYDIGNVDFAMMDNNMFNSILIGAKKQYEDKLAAEKKAEEERIAKEKADEAERQRIKIENEKLKAEAEAKEKELAAEKAKADAERKALEAKAAKEKEIADAKLKAEQEAAKAAAEKAAAEKAKLEAQLKAKADAEEKAKKEKEAEEKAKQLAAEKAAKAPIKQQLNSWVDSFSIGKPIKENKTSSEIEAKFEAFKNWAKLEIEKL